MIHIIYMAAGQSRRYGANKLLTLRGGKPLYRHGLDVMRDVIRHRADCTLVVVSCWQEILDALTAEEIPCVPCPNSHLGISHTIRAGIGACGSLSVTDYLCFCVADQPDLTAESVSRLLDATAQQPLTACLAAGEISGNPTLFSAVLADELLSLEGDRGGKAVMRRHPERHVDVPCEAKELKDIDVKEDD